MDSPSSSPPPVFTPLPALTEDQVACLCGHATDIHELLDLKVTQGADARLYWLFKCAGFYVPQGRRFGAASNCHCNNIRSPKPLPPVHKELPG